MKERNEEGKKGKKKNEECKKQNKAKRKRVERKTKKRERGNVESKKGKVFGKLIYGIVQCVYVYVCVWGFIKWRQKQYNE